MLYLLVAAVGAVVSTAVYMWHKHAQEDLYEEARRNRVRVLNQQGDWE